MRVLFAVAIFFGVFNGCVFQAADLRLEASGIEAVIVDNAAWGRHSARYNGVAFLSAGVGHDNIFRPLYGGFDLENYFDEVREQSHDTPQERNMLFEPRDIQMTLRKVSIDTVELHENAGPHWGVETWTLFRVRPPHYLNIKFHCIPRARRASGDFLGLFWANYVNSPQDGAYYFLGRKKPNSEVEWIRAYSPRHNYKATFMSDRSPVQISFNPDYGSWMWNNLSNIRYVYPFYYGVVRGQMYLLMFDQQDNIRFSHSPTGGGGTPAWDFQFIIPNYQVGHKYGFRARLVVKEFISREDAIQEFDHWSKKKVVLPSSGQK